MPIGTVTALSTTADSIAASFRFLPDDEFAARVERAWNFGAVRSASIGFLVRESHRNAEGGLDITAAELAEVSLCSVPANPSCTRILKSLHLLDRTPATMGAALIEVDEAVVQQTIKRALREHIGAIVTRELRQEMRLHSPLGWPGDRPIGVDLVDADPAVGRVRRAEQLIEVDPDQVATITRRVTLDLIRKATAAGLAKARGRVD